MELNEVLWAEVGLVLVSGLLYFILAVWRSTSQSGSKYTKREWNFYLKKIWSMYQINNWKQSAERNEIRLTNKTEEPIIINDHNSFDSQCFWAANSDGCSIYVAFHRKFGRISEIAIILTMSDGTVYRLPNQPDTVVFDASSNTWNAGNLKIILLEPFQRWRIIFNGMAIKGCKSEWTENIEKAIHLKMNFIWIAASIPIRRIDDCSTSLLAESIATEPWKDPNWLNGLKYYPVRGYDQYGSMSGSIVIDHSDDPSELFLSGIRERRWGLNYTKFMKRSFNISGKTTDGTFYNINVQSLKNRTAQLVFGNVRLPNSEAWPIEWTDIDISEIGEYPAHIRKAFTIRFKAGSKQFTSTVHLDKDKTNLLRGGRPWNWENLIIPFQGSINDYQGVGILQLGYNYIGDCPLQTINEIKQLQYMEKSEIKTNNICHSLKDQEARCSQFVGAKASSLALLMSVESKDYKVPNGFCLTVHALNLQIENNLIIQNAIKEIEEYNSNDKKELLQNACDRVYNLIKETVLYPPVKESVNIYFQELLNNEKLQNSSNGDLYFAVRSSGIGEDSEDLSAAGQNATILGCKSIDDIYAAIQKCWASLFTYQSVEYRRQHGQKVYCGMGVVIQTIVEAEAAGVMFTRHPMTGDPSCILITSNYGLGESVVSGKVEPDSIYIEKDLENHIKIKKIEIGSKSHKMTLKKNNNSVNDTLQILEVNEDSKKSSLKDEDCSKLGNIAISQEILWGSPRDIEWAISNGIIYLVQARPITTLQTWTEFELAHELDTAFMSDDDVMTFANTGEVLPGSYSPLSFSTITRCCDSTITKSAAKDPHAYFLQMMATTHHHVGINVLNTMLVNISEEITLSNKVNDIAIFGHIVTDEKMHSIALHRNRITGKIETMKEMLKFSMMLWNIDKKAKTATNFVETFEINLDKCTNSVDIYKKIDTCLPMLDFNAGTHCDVSSSSFFSQFLFFMILMQGKSDITTENYIDIGTVLSDCTNVISADVPTSLNELAKLIHQSQKAKSFIEVEPKNGLEWLQENCPDSHKRFIEFLEKHGHRSIKEFDMVTDTWGLNPVSLIAALQSILKIPIKNEKKKQEVDIVDRLVTPINGFTKKILKLLIPVCQKSVASREETKAALILIIHKFRLAYTKLAKQMMKEWKLPDEKLIFFMTHTELGRYLKHGEPEYINKAVLRRRFFSKWDSMKFSELQFGFPKPLETIVQTSLDNDNSIVVKGTPVCSGNIVARACVVHNLSEISQLKDGDILITHSTDIGWSPYFPILGGVVTELGGLISHGAVVAREYGLPCIVGAMGATSAFKTGDMVLLNATKGILQKNQ